MSALLRARALNAMSTCRWQFEQGIQESRKQVH